MGELSLIAKLFLDAVADAIELTWRDGQHRATALAVEVGPLVVTAEGIEPGAVAEVDVADKTVTFQQLEIAVDRAQVQSQASHDVLGRHRAVSREERLQHEPASGREPQAAAAQLRDGIGHVANLEGWSIGGEGHDSDYG
jgi:hypothetical protein